MATATLETRQTLPTTVFFVDDDSAVLKRMTKESLLHTNLGVLTAEHLSTAADLIGKYPIGAILADFNFRPQTQDHGRGLYNGLDFLEYAKGVAPRVPMYVMSIDSSDRSLHKEAEKRGLTINAWYDKLQPDAGQFSPWVRIERDLILNALKSEHAFREEAAKTGANAADLLTDERVAEKVRSIFNFPRLTYLQYLRDNCGYKLKEPLEVRCWPSNEGYTARASHVPLLNEAVGEDPVEALETLADMLIDEKLELDLASASKVSGYAKYIRDRLDIYVEPDYDLDREGPRKSIDEK